jgi:hypothetical protein
LRELHRVRRALGEWIIFEMEEMDVMFLTKDLLDWRYNRVKVP